MLGSLLAKADRVKAQPSWESLGLVQGKGVVVVVFLFFFWRDLTKKNTWQTAFTALSPFCPLKVAAPSAGHNAPLLQGSRQALSSSPGCFPHLQAPSARSWFAFASSQEVTSGGDSPNPRGAPRDIPAPGTRAGSATRTTTRAAEGG